jgi:hypothetical protein
MPQLPLLARMKGKACSTKFIQKFTTLSSKKTDIATTNLTLQLDQFLGGRSSGFDMGNAGSIV